MQCTAKRLSSCCALIAFCIVLCSGSLKAQFRNNEISRDKWSVGVEGGWMKNMQSGIFHLICKCPVQEGIGNSGIGGLFIEFQRNSYLSFGMKLGLDSKSTSTSTIIRDTAVITYFEKDSIASGPFALTRNVDVSATYFFFAPYFKISPFGEGVFIQIAPEFGILTSSRLTHTRELPSSQITLDNGQVISNVRFENGNQKEALQDGAIPNVRSSRIALNFSVGYDIPVFENFSIMPQASYNYPLTSVNTDPNESDWKISSYTLTLGIKYLI